MALVERLKSKYTITAILNALVVPRSTYYRWRSEGTDASLRDVDQAIIDICASTKYRYGHRKVRALLQRDYSIKRHRNTVQAIMQKNHLQCRIKTKKKWKPQGETVITAPDRIKRDFQAAAPNQKWVTDITYIQYGRTVKYLSTIMDLYNNEIVAAKLYDHQQTPLVLDTIKSALEKRAYPKGVIIHSDQGSVYTSYAYQAYVMENNLISSMSRRGNCWDNAVIESFHSNLKSEAFIYTRFNSLSDIETDSRVNAYLKYYNEERIQEKLGYLSPINFGVRIA
ncbi:Transposase InsO and inactivated derivatives [Aliicoccus persicus]|uniref:Transposase InsO and inactivated derivatives n=1 Tax=Aliicoccus persicus TaxID=930138 RepID=A0A662Z666_9STAP|nr:Transposase InsO and inactivated derivatives [Aliicoccus persicus]